MNQGCGKEINSQITTLFMNNINPRHEIVSMLRGFVSCPVISCLHEIGLLDRMVREPFSSESFNQIKNPMVLEGLFQYLESLGLLDSQGDDHTTYTVSELGQKVFGRAGGFNLLHSYKIYFATLKAQLFSEERPESITVDRAENILGSGVLHARKYFDRALNLVGRNGYDLLIDVGCGNGEFMIQTMQKFPSANLFAVDCSEIAVNSAIQRINKVNPMASASGAVAFAQDVADWKTAVFDSMHPLISIWFVIHEFAERSTEIAVRFFQDLYQHFPQADLIIGEIVQHKSEDLALDRHSTIMPEFLLFHTLSGQGVLTWDQWQVVLKVIPYNLVAESKHDAILTSSGQEVPSSFVWLLAAKENISK